MCATSLGAVVCGIKSSLAPGTLKSYVDEKVAQLHLAKLGVELEELSQDQADYISVPVKGPYKPEYYRY